MPPLGLICLHGDNMLTQEEFDQLAKDPGFQGFIQECKEAGVDPIKGVSFAKDFMAEADKVILPIKIGLEKEYMLDVSVNFQITMHGERIRDPLLKELLSV